MPSSRLVACSVLCGMFAVPVLGCGEDGSGVAKPEILGTWERYKFYEGSAETDQDDIEDTWTVTFRPDLTFSMSHVNKRIIAYADQVTTTSREGTYTGGTDGTVQMSGGWVENAADLTTLDGLAAIYMSFAQDTMYYMPGDTGDVMFIGPDFVRDSPFASGDSYNLLFSDGASSYVRESNLMVTDGNGDVIEKHVQSYAYTFIDQYKCKVTYSFDDDVLTLVDIDHDVKQGSGTVDCDYEFKENQSVKDLDGNPIDVSTVVFTYYIPDEDGDDVQTVDNFAILADGVLISYPENHQDTVLFDNAYHKVAD
jgi:hypothetical protein